MYTAYSWSVFLHIFGIVLWVGGLLGATQLLSQAGRVEKGGVSALVQGAARIERLMALPGFVLALLTGIYLLTASANLPMKQGWMHIKLTAVLLGLLPVQGLLGARRKKLREGGDPEALGRFFAKLFWITLLVAFVILYLIRMKPMNRVVFP